MRISNCAVCGSKAYHSIGNTWGCSNPSCPFFYGKLLLPQWNKLNALIRAARKHVCKPKDIGKACYCCDASTMKLCNAVRAFDKAFKVEGKG